MKFLLSVLAAILLASAANADDFNSDPVSWVWRTGSQISDQVKKGYRIVDLELYSTSPFRLTALLVRNTGSYAQTWWWYYNIDAATLKSKLAQHKARITDIEAYVLNGHLRFAVILTPNTGSHAKAWWYYYGVSPSYISEKLKEHGARLVDIDTYKVGSTTKYAVVMIKNSGADARSWWWYYNITPSAIVSALSHNKARLMDIEYNGNGRFSVIMEKSPAKWYWYFGLSTSSMLSNASQNKARLFHVSPYFVHGARKWAGIMIA